MKFSAALFITLILVLFSALGGCSNQEELPPLEEKVKVVRTIDKPPPKKEEKAVLLEQAVPKVEASPLEIPGEVKAEVEAEASEVDLASPAVGEDVSLEGGGTSLVEVEQKVHKLI